jgi:HK97 family phage prohead protease
MLRSLPSGEERRSLTLSDASVSVDAGSEDVGPRFGGHAAVFSSRTAIGNPQTFGFFEEIAPGAFSKTIAEGDARMLIDHDSAHVVSRVSAGTLRLSQDQRGLAVDSELDTNLSYVNDLVANLRNGNITGMSFGFMVVKDDWTTEEARNADGGMSEVEVRVIREAKLVEVSPVTFPAYESTDAGVRDSITTALRHRGDPEAIARRTKFRPELAELLGDVVRDEPAETTHDADPEVEPAEVPETEPAASTRYAPSQDELAKARLRALKLRQQLLAS